MTGGTTPVLRSVATHARQRSSLETGPASVFEAVTREMVEHVAGDLKEIKTRLDSVLWLLAGAILVDVVLRLGGS